MARLPQRTLLGQRGIGMSAHLRLELRLLGRSDAPGPPRARPNTPTAGQVALAPPTANRGWIDPIHGGDVSHAMTGIHRGQGSLTDVV